MLDWLLKNIGTIIICTVIMVVIAEIIVSMVKNGNKGKSACGCGCADCPMSCSCRPKK